MLRRIKMKDELKHPIQALRECIAIRKDLLRTHISNTGMHETDQLVDRDLLEGIIDNYEALLELVTRESTIEEGGESE